MAEPAPFQRLGLGYVFTPPELGIVLKARFLQRRGDSVTAELTLETTTGVILDTGTRHNLVSLQTRQAIVRHFNALGLANMTERTWQTVMVTFCSSILAAERAPSPVVRVGRMPRGAAQQRYLLTPGLAEGKLNGIHGPGGTGKGYIATLWSVQVQAGHAAHGFTPKQANVLYLDWEEVDDPVGHTTNERIAAVAEGMGIDAPEMDYIACRRSFRSMVEEIAAVVDHDHIGLVVIDSVEMAMGAGDEAQRYEQRFINFVEALRELGPVTFLLIDHVNALAAGNTTREPGQTTHAFGSVFKHNEIRWSWEVASHQEVDSPHLSVSLFHDKRNNAGRLKPIGLDLDFGVPTAVKFTRVEVADTQFANRLEMQHRIAHVLGHAGAMSAKDIAEYMGGDTKEDTVRRSLLRHSDPRGDMFTHLEDGRWGLLDVRGGAHRPGANGTAAPELPTMFSEAFGNETEGVNDYDSIPF